MKIVVQTVKNASVSVENQLVAHIDHGYLLLVGFTAWDNEEIIDKLVTKLLKLRIFPDENGKTNLSLNDVNGEILSVSQFTLYADVSGGNRPSFTHALTPSKACDLYHYFNKKLEEGHGPIKCGVFGADMIVTSSNIGPFTLILDSKELIK